MILGRIKQSENLNWEEQKASDGKKGETEITPKLTEEANETPESELAVTQPSSKQSSSESKGKFLIRISTL